MKPWTWRHAIINSTLPPTTRHVLITLSCHVNDAGEPAYPSTALLAFETGLSERAVVTHLRDAAGLGWLLVQKHGYGGQKWARNQYYPRIPEGFEMPDRDSRGTEPASVPSKTGQKKKVLKDVQQLVDKGTEPASVPSEKALNVATEGTERDGRKALNHVQSNTAVNPAEKAAAREVENDAAAAAQKISKPENTESELTELLVDLERERGKNLTIDRSRDRVHVLTWVGKGVTASRLREAHALAVAARIRDTDDRPTYVGFVSTFIDAEAATPAVPGTAQPDPDWWLAGEEVLLAAGERFGARPKRRDEPLPLYRAVVARAAGKGPWIDAILREAQRGGGQFQQMIVATIGEALLPVDWYAS
jgi:hypothetical protein